MDVAPVAKAYVSQCPKGHGRHVSRDLRANFAAHFLPAAEGFVPASPSRGVTLAGDLPWSRTKKRNSSPAPSPFDGYHGRGRYGRLRLKPECFAPILVFDDEVSCLDSLIAIPHDRRISRVSPVRHRQHAGRTNVLPEQLRHEAVDICRSQTGGGRRHLASGLARGRASCRGRAMRAGKSHVRALLASLTHGKNCVHDAINKPGDRSGGHEHGPKRRLLGQCRRRELFVSRYGVKKRTLLGWRISSDVHARGVAWFTARYASIRPSRTSGTAT